MIRGQAALPPDKGRAAGSNPTIGPIGLISPIWTPALPLPTADIAVPPPEHVLRAFSASATATREPPELLAGGQGRSWRCGNVVITPAPDPAAASWLANTFEQLPVSGVRLARPVRSSDGRWVVAGWSAGRFVSGSPAPRHDEIMQACDALHAALADIGEPRFLRDRTDLYSWADRLSWGEIQDDDGRTGSGHGARLFASLVAGRRQIDVTNQVVHGDLYRNVLFAGSAPPAVVDITPYWRPAGWAAAVVAIDALAWGGAPIELMSDWDRWPHWRQLLRRGLLFRLAVGLAHPKTPPTDLVTLLATSERLQPYLG